MPPGNSGSRCGVSHWSANFQSGSLADGRPLLPSVASLGFVHTVSAGKRPSLSETGAALFCLEFLSSTLSRVHELGPLDLPICLSLGKNVSADLLLRQ